MGARDRYRRLRPWLMASWLAAMSTLCLVPIAVGWLAVSFGGSPEWGIYAFVTMLVVVAVMGILLARLRRRAWHAAVAEELGLSAEGARAVGTTPDGIAVTVRELKLGGNRTGTSIETRWPTPLPADLRMWSAGSALDRPSDAGLTPMSTGRPSLDSRLRCEAAQPARAAAFLEGERLEALAAWVAGLSERADVLLTSEGIVVGYPPPSSDLERLGRALDAQLRVARAIASSGHAGPGAR